MSAEIAGIVVHPYGRAVGAVKDDVEDVLGQILYGSVERKTVFARKPLELHLRHLARVDIPAARLNAALTERQVFVDDETVDIYLVGESQPRAHGTGAVRIVERKQPRGHLLETEFALGTGVLGGIQHLFAVEIGDDKPLGEFDGGLYGFGETAAYAVLDDNPVHYHADVVLYVLVEGDVLVEGVVVAVDAHAHEARLPERLEHLGIFALAAAHDGRDNLHLCPLTGQYSVGNLIHRLSLDDSPAFGTMRHPDARVKQTQIVVNLGHRADGGTGVVRCGLLVYGNGGRKPLDILDIGLLHLPEELTGVTGQTLDITALTFGENGVESQRRLAAARQPRENDETVARQDEVDILEIVLLCAFDENFFHCTYYFSCVSAIYSSTRYDIAFRRRRQRICAVHLSFFMSRRISFSSSRSFIAASKSSRPAAACISPFMRSAS